MSLENFNLYSIANYGKHAFRKSSDEMNREIAGALIGAPIAASAYLAHRLVTGKKINPTHLLLAIAGGGVLGGLAGNLTKQPTEEGNPQVDKGEQTKGFASMTISHQTSIDGKPVDKVVKAITDNKGRTIGNRLFVRYDYNPDSGVRIGDLPSYNVYAEMNRDMEVPTVSAVYRGWLARYSQTYFHAALVMDYVQYSLLTVLQRDQIRHILNKVNQAVLETNKEILDALVSKNSEVGVSQIIEKNMSNFAKTMANDLLHNRLFANFNPQFPDHLFVMREIAQLSKPLFFSSLVLLSPNLSNYNIKPENADHIPTPFNYLSAKYLPDNYRGDVGILMRNYVSQVIIDTTFAANFERFMSLNPVLRAKIHNYYTQDVAKGKDIMPVVDDIVDRYFRDAGNIFDKNLFVDVINKMRNFDVTKSSNLPGVVSYLNNLVPPSSPFAEKMTPIEFFSSTLVPKPVFDAVMDPSRSVVGKGSLSTDPYRFYGTGTGATLGLLYALGSDLLPEEGKKGKSKRESKSFLGKAFKGLLGAAAGGTLGYYAGGVTNRLVSRYVQPDSDLILFDTSTTLREMGLRNISSFNANSINVDYSFSIPWIVRPADEGQNFVPGGDIFAFESESPRGLEIASSDIHSVFESDNTLLPVSLRTGSNVKLSTDKLALLPLTRAFVYFG